jgi:hypothetical protein
LKDFFRAHDLCGDCRANGKLLIGICWNDANGVEHNDSLGTDGAPVGVAELLRLHGLGPAGCWNYLYETCEACRGTGKKPAR